MRTSGRKTPVLHLIYIMQYVQLKRVLLGEKIVIALVRTSGLWAPFLLAKMALVEPILSKE